VPFSYLIIFDFSLKMKAEEESRGGLGAVNMGDIVCNTIRRYRKLWKEDTAQQCFIKGMPVEHEVYGGPTTAGPGGWQ
jgi:hypothetical protein